VTNTTRANTDTTSTAITGPDQPTVPPAGGLPELHRDDYVTILATGDAYSARDWRPLRRACELEVLRVEQFTNQRGEFLRIEGYEIGKRGEPLHDVMGADKFREVFVQAPALGVIRRALAAGDPVREPVTGQTGTVIRAFREHRSNRRLCWMRLDDGGESRRVRERDIEHLKGIESAPTDQASTGVTSIGLTSMTDGQTDNRTGGQAKDRDLPAPALPRRRDRKPSAVQAALLVDVAEHDGARAHELDGRYGVATWVAVEYAGWVRIVRGTPTNRGGDPGEYRHWITDAGRHALARAGVELPPPTSHHLDQGDPMAITCDACGAGPGETCDPDCLSRTI
jgi:hypothetical protein